MSKWDNIRKSVTDLASAAKEKTGDVADEAALRLRLGNAKREANDAYTRLGEAAYARLRLDAENTADVDDALKELDECIARIRKLEEQLEQLRARTAQKKEEKRAKKENEKSEQIDEVFHLTEE